MLEYKFIVQLPIHFLNEIPNYKSLWSLQKKMYVRLTCQAGKSFRYSVTEIQALEHTPFLCGPELLKKRRFVSSSENMAVLPSHKYIMNCKCLLR